jgi:hypothetical protein
MLGIIIKTYSEESYRMLQNKVVWPGIGRHREKRKDLARNKKKKGLWEEKSRNCVFSPFKNGNDIRERKWIFFDLKIFEEPSAPEILLPFLEMNVFKKIITSKATYIKDLSHLSKYSNVNYHLF